MKSTRTFLRKDVIQKRRKRALLRAFWLGFLSLVIITSGIFALHQGPLKIVSYRIDGVVEGNEKIIRQIVDDYVYNSGHYLIPLDTVFTFPTNQIQKLISDDHLVSEVSVRRKFTFPFEILITVQEKKIAHTVCVEVTRGDLGSVCDWYGLDEEGYIIKKIPNPIVATNKKTSTSTATTTIATTATSSVSTSSAATTSKSQTQATDIILLPGIASSTPYIRVEVSLLGFAGQESLLGKQLIHPDVIQTIFTYSNMLSKHNYVAIRYQVFDIKTHIYIKDNGYVIVPVGLTTKPEFEINKSDINEKVMYLESVLTDPNLSKNLYSSSTTSVINKNGRASTTRSTDTLIFDYIDARLAKKIFIDPKGKDSAQKSTSTNTTAKPN